MQIIQESEQCILMKFKNHTGRGQIRAYEVFPGILLSYSDFSLEQYESNYAQKKEMFGFEYCLDGKIEWERQDGRSVFLGPGSFMPYDYEKNNGKFQFPMHHYKGISFGIQTEKIKEALPKKFPVDLLTLKDHLQMGVNLDLSRNPQAAYVLGLVQEAEDQDDIYRKLACLELLLFLRDLKWSEDHASFVYLSKTQVIKVKKAARMILDNLDHRYTLKELSNAENIPITTLRRCFEGIYGCSAMEFAKKHRVEEAKRLLRETNKSTTEIAGMLGYDNPSKFASMFRSITKLSPQTYRDAAFEQNGV